MRRYRILYHHRIRSDDGQAVHVRELIGALRDAGHEVLECALVPKAEPAGGRGAPRGVALSPWQRLALPRRAVELLEIGYGMTGARRIEKVAHDFRPDFLYERYSLHCDAGLRAARAIGVPLLLEVNSPLTDEMARLGLLRFPNRARRTERRVLGAADRVLAVTEVLRGMLAERGATLDRTTVIPNGAVPTRYGAATTAAGQQFRAAHGFDERAFVLGFVGYMRDWHRLDLAVDLLGRPQLSDLRLVLIGEGPALAPILERARAARVADRVLALGATDSETLPGLVAGFDAALIPAINAYASPLKLFDSLAAGVPTIAPCQPNIEEILADGVNGVLFQPCAPESLERRVTELVEDRGRARAIGARGRADLESNDWTWAGNARRVIRVFEELEATRSITGAAGRT